MKAVNKLLSILLVVAMIFSFGIFTAAADANVEQEDQQEQEQNADQESGDDDAQSADLIVGFQVIDTRETAAGSGDKTVSSESGVAKIKVSEDETNYYASVADALEAAEEGQMVVLLTNYDMKMTVYGPITVPEGVTLSLNGMTVIFVPSQDEDAAILLENGAKLQNGAVEVRTMSTKDETFRFARAIAGEGAVTIKNVWVSNEGGYMLGGAAAAYDLVAEDENPGVYKIVEHVEVDNANDNDADTDADTDGDDDGNDDVDTVNDAPSADAKGGSSDGNENEEPEEEPAEEEPAEEEPGEEDGEETGEENGEETGEENGEETGEEAGEENGEEPEEDEIVVDPTPDIVAEEPDDTKIRNDYVEYEDLADLVNEGKYEVFWLVHELDWDISSFKSLKSLYIDQCTYPINGDITVPAGVTLTLKNGSVNGNITVNGTLVLDNVAVNGNINLVSTGTQAILNAKGDQPSANAVIVDGSSGPVSPNIASGKYGAISYTGPAANVVGGVSGGLFKNAVPTDICAKGTKPAASKDKDYPYTVAKLTASVKNTSGRTSADYFKKQPSKNYNLDFVVSPGLVGLSVKDAASKAVYKTLGSGDYNYYAAGGRVEISKSAAFLENLPAGALVLAFDLDGGGYVEFPLNVWANVSFSPSRYYKGSGTDITFDVTDLPLEIIMDTTDDDPGTVLKKGVNYLEYPNKVVFPAALLESLPGGYHNFFFKYDMGGQTYRLRCTVGVLVDYRVIKINDVSVTDPNAVQVDWYTNSGKALKLYADGPYEKFTGVKIGDVTLGVGNYGFYEGELGTIVNINPGYLNTLAKGNYPVTLLFSDGEATAQFTVHYGSASPRTGDSNNIALWVAVLVLSGAAVVALVPKKRKQK